MPLEVRLVTSTGEPRALEPCLETSWVAVQQTLRQLHGDVAWSMADLGPEGVASLKLDRIALRAAIERGRSTLWDRTERQASLTHPLPRKQADSLWADRLGAERDVPTLARAAFLDVLDWVASIMEADQVLHVALGDAP